MGVSSNPQVSNKTSVTFDNISENTANVIQFLFPLLTEVQFTNCNLPRLPRLPLGVKVLCISTSLFDEVDISYLNLKVLSVNCRELIPDFVFHHSITELLINVSTRTNLNDVRFERLALEDLTISMCGDVEIPEIVVKSTANITVNRCSCLIKK